ncbi:MAG: helix-turn-helix domain-containing protein [Ruminococcus sp.]|nr:helix-turn-helix domain-containing protein [Ruminococcus sp.]
MLDSKNLGKRLAFLRTKSGLSQEKLAEQSELSTQFIGQIERGVKNPTVRTMQKICTALGVTLSDFFADDSFDAEVDVLTGRLNAVISSKSDEEKLIILQMIELLDNFSSAER